MQHSWCECSGEHVLRDWKVYFFTPVPRLHPLRVWTGVPGNKARLYYSLVISHAIHTMYITLYIYNVLSMHKHMYM